MHACALCTFLVLVKAQRGHQIPGDKVTDGCEPLCGCQGLSLCALEEQQVLLTAEPSPVPLVLECVIVCVCVSELEEAEEAPDSLELELQAAESHCRGLGTKLRTSARAVSTLNS